MNAMIKKAFSKEFKEAQAELHKHCPNAYIFCESDDKKTNLEIRMYGKKYPYNIGLMEAVKHFLQTYHCKEA